MDECRRAGIKVLMITGDAKDTAVAIAREVRIFPPSPLAFDKETEDGSGSGSGGISGSDAVTGTFLCSRSSSGIPFCI